ncbi:hypothetical protein [Parasphingorhabdus litoris]|uniref:hypothetical protein n=1 Tax=Parasphingorhabdus litoris TaxID=394733 RepID=UPI001E2A6642|nr:hypothetical protein [Parasphingorhabdus litoris]
MAHSLKSNFLKKRLVQNSAQSALIERANAESGGDCQEKAVFVSRESVEASFTAL